MKKISSETTFLTKKVLPMAMFSMLVILGASNFLFEVRSNLPPQQLLVLLLGIAGFSVVLFKFLIFDLADEVFDDGVALVVRKSGIEQRIALSDIESVSYWSFTNPKRIVLRLKREGPLGNKVAFIPPVRIAFSFVDHPIARSLRERI